MGRILDVNGSTIVLDSFEDVENAFSPIVQLLTNGVNPQTGEKLNNLAKRKKTKTSYGYKDIKFNIKTSNGFIGELIVLDQYIGWMKDYAHVFYEIGRNLEPLTGDNAQTAIEMFGTDISDKIEKFNNALAEFSKVSYSNSIDGKLEDGTESAGLKTIFEQNKKVKEAREAYKKEIQRRGLSESEIEKISDETLRKQKKDELKQLKKELHNFELSEILSHPVFNSYWDNLERAYTELSEEFEEWKENSAYGSGSRLANLIATSLVMMPELIQLRENSLSSSAVGLSSYTTPSSVVLRTLNDPNIPPSRLNGISSTSKYSTAINSSSTNSVQEQGQVVNNDTLLQSRITDYPDDIVKGVVDSYIVDKSAADFSDNFVSDVLREVKYAYNYPERNYSTVTTPSLLYLLRAEARQSTDFTDFVLRAEENYGLDGEEFDLEDLQNIFDDVNALLMQDQNVGTLEAPNVNIEDKAEQFTEILSSKSNFEEFLNALRNAKNLDGASLFINNLLASLNDNNTLTTDGFRIAYGQVLESPELYMDLYAQATGNTYWQSSEIAGGEISEEMSSE